VEDKLDSIVSDVHPTNPWAVLVAALGAGYLLAKAVAWRGHVDPR
jgi:hypothetical protein